MAQRTQALRRTYVLRLHRAIDDQDVDILCLMDDIGTMEKKIGKTTIPMNPLFSSETHFWAEFENGNFDAQKIYDQAWDRMNQELFRGDLRGYGFSSLPFIVTRNITHLENMLHGSYVEAIVLEEYNDCLANQLEDLPYLRSYKKASEYDSE